MTTFLLNGRLFVLVGLQLPLAVIDLTSAASGTALLVTAGVYVTILLTRIGFITGTVYLIRLLDRRPQQRLLRTTGRGRIVSMTAGFRGAVSLAVALAVPEPCRANRLPGSGHDCFRHCRSGRDLPHRPGAGVAAGHPLGAAAPR